MLKVKIEMQKELVEEGSANKEVLIKILLNIPQVSADILTGFIFTNAPEYVLSQIKIPFADMKKVMEIHKLENWQQVAVFLENMYTAYFTKLSNFSVHVQMTKVEHPLIGKIDADIKVFMSTPELKVSDKGFVFGETPSNCVSQTTISFGDMKKVLKHYKIYNWKQAKKLLAEKYSKFFEQVFHDWFVEQKHA